MIYSPQAELEANLRELRAAAMKANHTAVVDQCDEYLNAEVYAIDSLGGPDGDEAEAAEMAANARTEAFSALVRHFTAKFPR